MCLALIAFGVHPRYRIVVAANRDEYHARPAAPAAWWNAGILAGRDLKAGGTWLGADRRGRFALLTNVREPSRHDPAAPSRGMFVPDLLTANAPPAVSLPTLVRTAADYNGFNLIAGDAAELLWGSNRTSAPMTLGAGIYGISNHLLDTPWPKVVRTKEAFRRWCESGATGDFEAVLALLRDPVRAADEALPATGVTLERERMLSSPFIVSADYGTRCSTVLTIDRDDNAHFVERRFDPAGNATGEVEYRFPVTGNEQA